MRFRFLTIDDFDVKDKRVFLRVDINSPIDPSTLEILDDSRIKATKETLDRLTEAKVVIGSHQSRPGMDDFTSLKPHAQLLERCCSQELKFVDDVLGPHAKQAIKELRSGQALLLDNLRLAAEENIEGPPEKLVKTHLVSELAPLFDLYINDAFAAAHRSQPSLVGFALILPAAAGKLMERELNALNRVLDEPERPCMYVLGGSKIEDKVPVVENILKNKRADRVLLGGLTGLVFLKAMGYRIGKKNDEQLKGRELYVQKARQIVRAYKGLIDVPDDLAINRDERRVEMAVDRLPEELTLDVGKKTVKKYSEILRRAKTIVATGPLGVFEIDGFDFGTKSLLQRIGESSAFTVIGGGHLVGLAGMLGIEDRFSHISTAGGAMLSLLSGQSLPAIEALARAAERQGRRR